MVVPRRLGPMVRRWLGCEVVEPPAGGAPRRPGCPDRGGSGEALDRARRSSGAAARLPRWRPDRRVVRGRHGSLSGDDRAAGPGGRGAATRVDVGTASGRATLDPRTRPRSQGCGSTRRGPDPLGHPLSAAAAPALDGAARPAGRPFRCSRRGSRPRPMSTFFDPATARSCLLPSGRRRPVDQCGRHAPRP